jgi:F-type H+-transporting ATPase subunit epsilon
VTPAHAIVHDEVDELQLPGEEGSFGVLPGHAPMLAALATGMMWSRKGTEKTFAFIAGGFAEVLPDRVSILAQVAERAEDIDIERAEASKRRAEEQLAKPGVVDLDMERARIAMLRAISRLEISRHARNRP